MATVYFLIMYVIPIFVGSLFINDISTQSVSLMLIAGIGYIIWNAIQMSRIDNAIQKHWEEHLNEHWNEFDESTRRMIKRSCMRTDT